jgi:hypothetical protein
MVKPVKKNTNKKKGKKFVDTNQMLELVNSISNKEEDRVKVKMERHVNEEKVNVL